MESPRADYRLRICAVGGVCRAYHCYSTPNVNCCCNMSDTGLPHLTFVHHPCTVRQSELAATGLDSDAQDSGQHAALLHSAREDVKGMLHIFRDIVSPP